jgi:hypothetical protein
MTMIIIYNDDYVPIGFWVSMMSVLHNNMSLRSTISGFEVALNTRKILKIAVTSLSQSPAGSFIAADSSVSLQPSGAVNNNMRNICVITVSHSAVLISIRDTTASSWSQYF